MGSLWHADYVVFRHERLVAVRKAKGLSIRELAARAQLGAPLLSRYERGQRTPKSAALASLAQALEVSSDYLLGIDVVNEERSLLIAIAHQALDRFSVTSGVESGHLTLLRKIADDPESPPLTFAEWAKIHRALVIAGSFAAPSVGTLGDLQSGRRRLRGNARRSLRQ